MVRVFIKGGVWKNSEDEILKAAVMKYGKQQWARVASLLNRKSAKQCKARWNEWLDPSVKKVEWNRTEDEKLLHLAKLLPAQWKTIAPLLGRTATQCQDRYERLLDEAAAAAASAAAGAEDQQAGGSDGVDAGATTVTVDRKLRPGEIDPHPETKPARPDPIDMDEDEIEMLQEARARLANTQGKKAKRKQREKLLAEAKRLADLQKRRELKAAGLLSGQMSTKARTKKRQREIDFGVEIPFHKPAPSGYHDVSNEKIRTELARAKRLKDINYQKINEDQYRSRDKEAMLNEKKEKNRLRNLERDNMQLAVATAAAKSDPTSVQNRVLPNLPLPKRTDDEVTQDSSIGKSSSHRVHFAVTNDITDGLVGDYARTTVNGTTTLSLPMVGKPSGGAGAAASVAGMSTTSVMSRSERIQREAQNLRRLERGETPLLGGYNSELNKGGAGTGASLMGASSTLDQGGDSASTMAASAAGAMGANTTSLNPELRNQLGLNTMSIVNVAAAANSSSNSYSASNPPSHYTLDETASIGGSTLGTTTTTTAASVRSSTKLNVWHQRLKEERRAAKRARQELEEALAALPTPQFEYELAVPGVDTTTEEEEGKNIAVIKDQAELDELEMKRLQQKNKKLYESQSTVLKRKTELPRPTSVVSAKKQQQTVQSLEEMATEMKLDLNVVDDKESSKKLVSNSTSMKKAIHMIQEESLRLMQHDAIRYPSENNKKSVTTSVGLLKSKIEPLESIEEEQLSDAKMMLQNETQKVIQAALSKSSMVSNPDSTDNTNSMVDPILVTMNINASKQGVLEGSKQGTKKENIQMLCDETKLLEMEVSGLKKHNDKLEQKLSIHNGGYKKNCQKVLNEYKEAIKSMRTAEIEASVYMNLSHQEDESIRTRLTHISKELYYIEKRESHMQQEYGSLLHTQKRLQKQLR